MQRLVDLVLLLGGRDVVDAGRALLARGQRLGLEFSAAPTRGLGALDAALVAGGRGAGRAGFEEERTGLDLVGEEAGCRGRGVGAGEEGAGDGGGFGGHWCGLGGAVE